MKEPDPRSTLLSKVIDYYAEHGVRDTSLRTLAAAIGTSQRMLNYHFGSRVDLLAAVVETIASRQAALIGARFDEERDPFDAGRRNWEATAGTGQVFGPLFFELATHAMHGEAYAERLGRVIVEENLSAFTRAYETLTDGPHAEVLARLTLSVGQGALFNLLIDGDRPAADAAIAEFTAMVRAAIGPPNAEPRSISDASPRPCSPSAPGFRSVPG